MQKKIKNATIALVAMLVLAFVSYHAAVFTQPAPGFGVHATLTDRFAAIFLGMSFTVLFGGGWLYERRVFMQAVRARRMGN